MGAFLALSSLEDFLPKSSGHAHPTWYPVGYAVKIGIVAGLAWLGRRAWVDFRPKPSARVVAMAMGLGLVVAAAWVGLEALPYPKLPFLGKRQAFDPYLIGRGRAWFLAARLFGMVLLVPLVEELFWRSFLLRWIVDSDFMRVPIGKVTPAAAVITSVLFASAHPEWLPALLTGFAWAGLLWYTKSLSACLISHIIANLALGVYVLTTGDWRFW
jgi:CAAX prenyl protease-like protein